MRMMIVSTMEIVKYYYLKLSLVAGRKKLQKRMGEQSPGVGGTWIDEERQNLRAYEYLCHVGEAKEYIL